MTQNRSFDVVADRIDPDLHLTCGVECRAHHIEQPFDVAGTVAILRDAPFCEFELLGGGPERHHCIDPADAPKVFSDQLDGSFCLFFGRDMGAAVLNVTFKDGRC
jgi:hypothetical protein